MKWSFDENVLRATNGSVTAAVIFDSLLTLMNYTKAQADGGNYRDGKYWFKFSGKDWEKYFHGMFSRQNLATAFRHLKEAGLIETAHYDALALRNVTFYTITAKGYELAGCAEDVKHIERVTKKQESDEKAAADILDEIAGEDGVQEVFDDMTSADFGIKPQTAAKKIKAAGVATVKACIRRVRAAIEKNKGTDKEIRKPAFYLMTAIDKELKRSSDTVKARAELSRRITDRKASQPAAAPAETAEYTIDEEPQKTERPKKPIIWQGV